MIADWDWIRTVDPDDRFAIVNRTTEVGTDDVEFDEDAWEHAYSAVGSTDTWVVATCSRDYLLARVFLWVSQHPGSDAEGVAVRFGLSPMEASDIVESLLNRGLLDFQE
jgi:hypothetical protein